MDYGIAEEEISQRINAMFAELDLAGNFFAAPMPDTEAEVKAFDAHLAKARCAIEFIDTSFDPTAGMGAVSQQEGPKFRLLFDARKMRGDAGAFRMIAHVKTFLIGHKLTNAAGPLVLSDYGKLQLVEGFWCPFLEFTCKAMNNQVGNDFDPAIGGELSQIFPDTVDQ